MVHYSIADEIRKLKEQYQRSVSRNKPDERFKDALDYLNQLKGPVACGAEDVDAVLIPEDVDCPKCQVVIDNTAFKKGDPIVKAMINNMDLKNGQDFNLVYESVGYHGVSGAIHRIPRSVADHLIQLAVPQKAYKENQEAGMSIVSAGVRHRFIVVIHEVMGQAGPTTQPIPETKQTAFKIGDEVDATFEGGDVYKGSIVKIVGDKYTVHFTCDDTENDFVESELAATAA